MTFLNFRSAVCAPAPQKQVDKSRERQQAVLKAHDLRQWPPHLVGGQAVYRRPPPENHAQAWRRVQFVARSIYHASAAATAVHQDPRCVGVQSRITKLVMFTLPCCFLGGCAPGTFSLQPPPKGKLDRICSLKEAGLTDCLGIS